VFIDEIDKIARKITHQLLVMFLEKVQQALTVVVNVPPKGGRKHPDQNL
jgi:ATP-dependent Clp protease ATP-binding subunit ClpX